VLVDDAGEVAAQLVQERGGLVAEGH
jgi:hypothetical protein